MSTTTTLNVPTGPKKKGKVKRGSSGINAEYGESDSDKQPEVHPPPGVTKARQISGGVRISDHHERSHSETLKLVQTKSEGEQDDENAAIAAKEVAALLNKSKAPKTSPSSYSHPSNDPQAKHELRGKNVPHQIYQPK
eukprot:TRINITY_DN3474_c0_g1_i3.p1 TRINITY_DN3474_c0_g1~~TRINITY_DN3474_c0_g1_i3.p1  ORF type:complete len:138 (-),score=37.04 TRINITY_DN3474_c0_g1_i3:40-453(-)